MNKEKVDSILRETNFYEFVKSYSKKGYAEIDYGTRLGKKVFNSLLDADAKYAINSVASEADFKHWREVLNNKNSKAEELLIVCITIFDWGLVTASNVKKVLEMYKSGDLKNYIQFCTDIVATESLLIDSEKNQKLLWSAGWTKVYSAMNPKFLIYDSRVAAYLIYLLDKFHDWAKLDSDSKSKINSVTSYLFAMNSIDRKRKLESDIGFKKSQPQNSLKAFNGNLVASWIVQLLCKEVFPCNNERQLERAFFMLGFDLDQLKINDANL